MKQIICGKDDRYICTKNGPCQGLYIERCEFAMPRDIEQSACCGAPATIDYDQPILPDGEQVYYCTDCWKECKVLKGKVDNEL